MIEYSIQLLRIIDLPSVSVDTVGALTEEGQRYVVTGSVFSQRLYVLRVRGLFPRGIYCVVLEGTSAAGRSQSDTWTITADGVTDLNVDVQLQGRAYTEFSIRLARQDLPESMGTPTPLPS